MTEKIGIIGGGPAGLMAASIIESRKKDITLVEKNNTLGKKLSITGNGRCNITNASGIESFFDNITSNKFFMYSSLYSFTNYDVIEMFNNLGVNTKIEKDNKVFPVSDDSNSVIKAMNKLLMKNQTRLLLNSKVVNIYLKNQKFLVELEENELIFDKIIIATGGKSYPGTGSTGDGYSFAAKLGHTIITPKPSLVPIETNDLWKKDLQGTSMKKVNLKVYDRNKLAHEEFGEMIFTHYGISGPIVLRTSNYLHNYKKEDLAFKIDLRPNIHYKKLDNIILDILQQNPNKLFRNILIELLPKKTIPTILYLANIDKNRISHQITKRQRNNLVNIIKNFPVGFKGFRSLKEAMITSGGVSTEEINSSTMESKLVPNLFFAGELIDVEALTGGYNLQIAFSTGYLAGVNV